MPEKTVQKEPGKKPAPSKKPKGTFDAYLWQTVENKQKSRSGGSVSQPDPQSLRAGAAENLRPGQAEKAA